MFVGALAGSIRLLCGVRLLPPHRSPARQAIYFANHSSHLDFAVVWSALPAAQRRRARPVAGRDYWEKTRLRRWLARDIFNAVLIERQKVTASANPLAAMLAALDAGDSLIVFPEGTRSPDGTIHDFKPGLYHLARARPEIPLVPILLENLNRILPKSDLLPLPIIGSLTLGAPVFLQPDETKTDFLARARESVLGLRIALPS